MHLSRERERVRNNSSLLIVLLGSLAGTSFMLPGGVLVGATS